MLYISGPKEEGYEAKEAPERNIRFFLSVEKVERFQIFVYICYKERVHSEMKISGKIKLDPNIMPFAFFFS